MTANPIRIAALSDIHCGRNSAGTLRPLFAQVAEQADIVVICGDLTDYGLAEEAQILIEELRPVAHLPRVAVLGNHDYESGQQDQVRALLCDAGLTILDGDACEVNGVGFAGTKGFAGGFGRATLGYWGEPMIKQFVQEAIDEALKLETALARLRSQHRIAMLHYAPVAATVAGEPPEIFTYLGCSRLEEPLLRFPVDYVLHGHAHGGSPEGSTTSGAPVYNVSLPLLQRHFPDQPPFRLIELAV